MASEEVMLSGNYRNNTPLDLCIDLYVNRMSKVIIVLVLCISDKRVIHVCVIPHAAHNPILRSVTNVSLTSLIV